MYDNNPIISKFFVKKALNGLKIKDSDLSLFLDLGNSQGIFSDL